MKFILGCLLIIFISVSVRADLISVTYGGNTNEVISSNPYINSFYFGNSGIASNNTNSTTPSNNTDTSGLLKLTESDIRFICGLFQPFIVSHTNSTGGLNYSDNQFFAYKDKVAYKLPAFMGDSLLINVINNNCKAPKKSILPFKVSLTWILIILTAMTFISAYYINKNALMNKLLIYFNRSKKDKEKNKRDPSEIAPAPNIKPGPGFK